MSEREGWGSTSFVIDSDVLIDHLHGYEVAMDFIDSLLLDGARSASRSSAKQKSTLMCERANSPGYWPCLRPSPG